MKVVIHQTSKYEETLLEHYSVLEKYKDNYIPEIDYDDPNFDFTKLSDYWREDCIIVNLSRDEIIELVEELIKEERVIIQYADSYEYERYGIDVDIEIYNDMRE